MASGKLVLQKSFDSHYLEPVLIKLAREVSTRLEHIPKVINIQLPIVNHFFKTRLKLLLVFKRSDQQTTFEALIAPKIVPILILVRNFKIHLKGPVEKKL